ncbi:hypothetical protein K8I31_15310 [bacterium]|nr:hypothetical protein [bacterium]
MERVHGYAKDAWIVRHQSSLSIHAREDLDKVTEVPLKQIKKLLSVGPHQRLGSLIFLNEGWNFGASNLLFYREPNKRKGQQAAYQVLEVQMDGANAGSIVQVRTIQNRLAPFSSLMNDEVLLVSPDVDLAFNTFMLSGKSSLYALRKQPDGEFSSEPIEIDVPDDAFVSKFPAGNDSLLIYRNGTFFQMKWDTGEMTELYSMN